MRSSLRQALLPGLALLASVAEGSSHETTGTKGQHIEVNVGNGALAFDKAAIKASVGDYVVYKFFSANHSVVQSSFKEPCKPLLNGDKGPINSAFVPQPEARVASATTFRIRINDTKPLWFYCGQGNHCQQGMVHSINAPDQGENTHDAFVNLAKAVKEPTKVPESEFPGGIPNGGVREVHVEVGVGTEFKYVPNDIRGPPGTHVKFNFNPKNHSVVQSSFDKPCVPIDDAITSGFIPVSESPSHTSFVIPIVDAKPIWLYCAQGRHCQSGMVASINAPKEGDKTLQAYTDLAKDVGQSSIPPHAPFGGVVHVKGVRVADFGGNVLNAKPLDQEVVDTLPEPGENVTESISHMAGGGKPLNGYNWAANVSDEAVDLMQVAYMTDKALLGVAWSGYHKMQAGGDWAGLYPPPIVGALGTMFAQAVVHRDHMSDSLKNYKMAIPGEDCKVEYDEDDMAQWLEDMNTMLRMSSALSTSIMMTAAAQDPWMIPLMATQLSTTSRMAAMCDMMQNHKPATVPRDASMPPVLAWAYIKNKFMKACSLDNPIGEGKDLQSVSWSQKHSLGGDHGTTTAVNVALPDKAPEDLWMTFIGCWGNTQSVPIRREDGFCNVPEMYGHVWGLVTTKPASTTQDILANAYSAPEPLWVAEPYWSDL